MSLSLKDFNRAGLALIVVANVALYLGVLATGFNLHNLSSIIFDYERYAASALIALLVGVANAQLSADAKARIVFCRWQHPLPGCRAFTKIMKSDPRIDVTRLRAHHDPLPEDPDEQNRLWYRWYREYRDDPSVLHVHREFLFTRDWAVLTLVLLIALGALAFFQMPATDAGIYVGLMLVQLFLVVRAAQNHGNRFVSTILANKSSE